MKGTAVIVSITNFDSFNMNYIAFDGVGDA